MDDEHILALVEAVHGADFDAIGVFAPDANFGHDISHAVTLAVTVCNRIQKQDLGGERGRRK